MIDQIQAVDAQTERQVAHWVLAASRLQLDDLASPDAWGHLERYLGVSLRRHLTGVIARLQGEATALTALRRAAQTPAAAAEVRRKLLAFRQQYLRTETTLDFFADAIPISLSSFYITVVIAMCNKSLHLTITRVIIKKLQV